MWFFLYKMDDIFLFNHNGDCDYEKNKPNP